MMISIDLLFSKVMELTAPPPAKTSKKNEEKKKMLQAKVKLINIFLIYSMSHHLITDSTSHDFFH